MQLDEEDKEELIGIVQRLDEARNFKVGPAKHIAGPTLLVAQSTDGSNSIDF
jgi:hypothetical protein